MSEVSRKDFLKFIGATGAAVAVSPVIGWRGAEAAGTPLGFTPLRLPQPLPIYGATQSFLPTGLNGVGVYQKPDPDLIVEKYKVVDDVIVPPEFERYIVVTWGDLVFPSPDDYFGYNNDYTAYVPIQGIFQGWLVVNHEYISYPFHQKAPGAPTPADPAYPAGPEGRSFETAVGDKIGLTLPDERVTQADRIALEGEFLYNCGLSVVKINRNRSGHYSVIKDPLNRRVTGLNGLALNASRPGYPTSWGSLSHQQGNDEYLVGTGPAATEVFPLSADGLGNKIIGTFANCSGGYTPWGTALSCEENFQGDSVFYNGVTEAVQPNGTQLGYTAGTTGEVFGMVGEKYGWTVEIDPRDPGVPVKKHTWLGRFRHENVAIRAEAGNPLIVYTGDDRRGGHWWKFVSTGEIGDIRDPGNSRLFEDGVLYVAQFNKDGTGKWLPLKLSTPTNPNLPTDISSVQFAEQGLPVDRDGFVPLPRRIGIAGQATDGGRFNLTRTNQAMAAPGYQGKTLADFYPTQGALLCDAFLAANLIGGTPCARPEDVEVHPVTKAVYMANTDGAPGGDGYPDSRIFVVAKYKADLNYAQQSGDILKLIEDSSDGAGLTFKWERFVKGGEFNTLPGAEAEPRPGDGFANVDNLTFDAQGNLWGCIDMSTEQHNGFATGLVLTPTLTERVIDHALVGSGPATPLVGVFGNNWLYYVPTSGPLAGVLCPFAQGANRSEMTGPTIVDDTLFLSVQHPGEDTPIRGIAKQQQSREIQILKPDGSVFNQQRTITIGSQWPSNTQGVPAQRAVPKPAVVAVRRKGSQFSDFPGSSGNTNGAR